MQRSPSHSTASTPFGVKGSNGSNTSPLRMEGAEFIVFERFFLASRLNVCPIATFWAAAWNFSGFNKSAHAGSDASPTYPFVSKCEQTAGNPTVYPEYTLSAFLNDDRSAYSGR